MPTARTPPPGYVRGESANQPADSDSSPHHHDDDSSIEDEEEEEDLSHWHNFDVESDDDFESDNNNENPVPLCRPVNTTTTTTGTRALQVPILPPLASARQPRRTNNNFCTKGKTPLPWQLLNDRRSKKKKTKEDATDEDIIIAFLEFFEEMSNFASCRSLGSSGDCTCLHVLKHPDIREAVAYYCLSHGMKGYEGQHQPFVDWFRYYYSDMQKSGQARVHWEDRPYLLPFDSSSMVSFDLLKEIQTYKICTTALHAIFNIGKWKWDNIKRAALTTGVAKQHGHKGKKRALDDEIEVGRSLHEHFKVLMQLGEVRATRFVSVETEGGGTQVTTRDDNDLEDVYLPAATNGIRPCYYRWCKERGWEVEPKSNGTCKKTIIEVGSEQPIVCLQTYYQFWKRHYKNLKVSSRAEDICAYCFQYANRRKFNLSDNQLYPDPDSTKGKQSSEESTSGDEGGSDEEEGGAEEPPAEEGNADTITITIPRFEDGEDAPAVNPDEMAPNPGDESAEQMLLRAAKHIKCARAQRALYQRVVRKARDDAIQNKPHKLKSYAFVVDYRQNMSLPSFNSEQPGTVYYYSPLNIYNLGVVDHAHIYDGKAGDPKEHMYAHVYHVGVAKKGMNNVCSLIMKTLSQMNLLRGDDAGKELNIVFVNCTGQNKNNTVLRLVPFLVEMGFFEQVNFIFLVVGHTKNAADRLFNALKKIYRKENLYTMAQMIEALNASTRVSVTESEEKDFLDYESLFNLFYRKFDRQISHNHIFSCSVHDKTDNELIVKFRVSDRACDQSVSINCLKKI